MTNRKTIAICGYTGSIGSAITEEAADAGLNVILVDSHRPQASAVNADMFVNAAGFLRQRPLCLIEDGFSMQTAVLIEPILAFLQHNSGKNVSVLAISSVAALKPVPSMAEYCVSRAALNAFVRSAAYEYKNAKVNALLLGGVHGTNMHEKLKERSGKEAMSAYDDKHLHGMLSVKNAAQFALSLLTAPQMTGSLVVQDSGFSLS